MPQFHNLLFGGSGAEIKSLELHPLLENLLQKIIKDLNGVTLKFLILITFSMEKICLLERCETGISSRNSSLSFVLNNHWLGSQTS